MPVIRVLRLVLPLLLVPTLVLAAPWPHQHLAGHPAHPSVDHHEGHHPASGDADGGDTEAGEGEDDAAWNVDDPPGEEYEATIDVTSGTWMNLDVSPDGEEIVFDLLGDLYTLPIEGGEAKALSSGLAWDMQPRYSPDGRHIAFTSDAGGGDNIWIMARDGSDRTAVTDESFRLLNNAAWSPDGDYVAARKHFTSGRSLGAGEIWLYHRTGGAGLQLTEKPNDQKDVGEPAFSPDGRYVYFSQDTTSGPVFEYNKDPNTEIYSILRLDRRTGEIEPFVTGAGGAIRPTPSPDGEHLAFVRRVRYKTALFLHDLATGDERMLTDTLERDHQETWAIHGVYANFAWTPDGDSIVYWAGGGLHRIDVASGTITGIPFRVRQTHTMVEALRVPTDPAPATFPTRMLRWVEVSPRGDQVLFQALGHIYLQPVGGGAVRRLTTQNDHFELYPSFSRDGSQVVYVSWDDQELGHVRIAPTAGGAGRVLTNTPGHYLEPTLSPDGATVVYRKTAGGFLSKDRYGRELGLYRVDAGGGPSTRIATGGSAPHFGASSERVFYFAGGGDQRSLDSVRLDRTAEDATARTHLTSSAALSFRVSPDGNWVAFTERFKAFVVPWVEAGKPIAVGPGTSSIPLHQVASDAGEYVHWSGDGSTLHWALGNSLYSRPLTDSFAFLDGAPETLPEATDEGTTIGFEVKHDIPSGTVALVGGRIVTIDGSDRVIENGTVVVHGNKIAAVGPRDEVDIPADAHVVDITGHTVIPGLVDVHWHGSQGFSEITPEQNWFNLSSLAFGVTTIHDPSTDTSTFFAAAEMQRAGHIVAPRLYSTGTILYGADGAGFKSQVDSLEDARFHLRRMKAAGAISVKSYNQPRRDQRQQIITAAREIDMMVVPEGGSLFMHNMTQIVDGHTGIEHAIPVAKIYDDVLQLWSQSRTGYTPTIVVGYGGIWGENYWYAKTDVWAHERLLSFTPREFVDPRARRPFTAPEEEWNHFDIARACKQLADLGVKVNIGAHGQREGLGAHWETWMLGQGGMTPLEALRAATLNGAHYIGMDAHIGSIEEGKLADLAILAKNPLENLRNTDSVAYTMINGRLYDAATMNQVGNHPEPRQPLFWED